MKDSSTRIKEITQRLMRARMRILLKQGFYGLLLMHVKFGLDSSVKGAAASSDRIVFNPEFIELLSEAELDYCLNHQVMHIAMKHCMRKNERDDNLFWRACDIVVNSNILYSSDMNENSIFLFEGGGVQEHLSPSGREGYECTAEEVYEELSSDAKESEKGDSWDDHSLMNSGDEDDARSGMSQLTRAKWQGYVKNAAEAIKNRERQKGCGRLPLFAERFLGQLHRETIDWKTILNEFVQEEINDYTFSPPDRRFGESDFFLPDFAEKDETVKNVLFMIDASGSMSDDDIVDCFSEVKGAVDQFAGHLSGWLGFFDAKVSRVQSFDDVSSLKEIRPKGGGGTDFFPVFKYAADMEEPPISIIILTDGLAPYPPEKAAGGIPTLWVLTEKKRLPPWGKTAIIGNK